jgi:hypothetical protein
MLRRDGFYRPVLGRRRDVTVQEHKRPGMTIYRIPVYRNLIRRGTLIVTLASYTNGDISVDSKYEKKPWAKSL